MKTFARDINNKPDYSGFTTSLWPRRNGIDHKRKGQEWLGCANKSEREKFEYQHGVRFSEFYRLLYFDPVRMHLTDAMHNLMLCMILFFLTTRLQLVERIWSLNVNNPCLWGNVSFEQRRFW